MDLSTPSMTARAVAAHRLRFQRLPAPTGDPAADEKLQASIAQGSPAGDGPFRRYLARRTLFFDRAVVDTLSAGCTQVVVLGAGYDGRSMRYYRQGVAWFELDHPATSADKRRRLEELSLPARACGVPVDFEASPIGPALRSAGFDAGKQTLMLCEGVTPYLGAATVRLLLNSTRELASSTATLAIDFALQPPCGAQTRDRLLLERRVNELGEPFRFTPHGDAIVPLLAETGWRVESAVDPGGKSMTESVSRTVFVLASPERS